MFTTVHLVILLFIILTDEGNSFYSLFLFMPFLYHSSLLVPNDFFYCPVCKYLITVSTI